MWRIDSEEAFERALDNGTFWDDEYGDYDAIFYAGDYMYMYTSSAGDHFKHRDTRQYVVSSL